MRCNIASAGPNTRIENDPVTAG
ncbi:unnamed protein product, partial [Rotaria sp. Silwood2]